MTYPSEKLLTEILGKEVSYCTVLEKNLLGISYENGWQDKINIYEFQHLAKKWALHGKNYTLSSHCKNDHGICCAKCNDIDGEEFTSINNSEFEAVIASCERLLREVEDR